MQPDQGLTGRHRDRRLSTEFLDLKRSLTGSVLAALAASVCCVLPLVLVALGIGGAWMANLTALAPARPYFVAVTLVFLALAFRRLYLVPQGCKPGTACATPQVRSRQRVMFWVMAGVLLALLAVPWTAPLFY